MGRVICLAAQQCMICVGVKIPVNLLRALQKTGQLLMATILSMSKARREPRSRAWGYSTVSILSSSLSKSFRCTLLITNSDCKTASMVQCFRCLYRCATATVCVEVARLVQSDVHYLRLILYSSFCEKAKETKIVWNA